MKRPGASGCCTCSQGPSYSLQDHRARRWAGRPLDIPAGAPAPRGHSGPHCSRGRPAPLGPSHLQTFFPWRPASRAGTTHIRGSEGWGSLLSLLLAEVAAPTHLSSCGSESPTQDCIPSAGPHLPGTMQGTHGLREQPTGEGDGGDAAVPPGSPGWYEGTGVRMHLRASGLWMSANGRM